MKYKHKLIIIAIILLVLFITFFIMTIQKENIKFNDNLILLETKAKSYLTYNYQPILIEKTITLEELYNKEIVPKLYYNFSECNKKSYITIVKKNNFYEMTTTLICSNKTETIKTYFN